MNNNIKSGIIIVGLVLILLVVAFFINLEDEELVDGPTYTITNDSLKFQKEYQKYNKTDGTDNVYIKSYNSVIYTTYEKINALLDDESNNYMILLGSSENKKSREVASTIIDVALENNKDVYYLDISNDMDIKKLKKGKIITSKKGTDNYNNLVLKLYDYLPVYEGLNDDTIKRIYLPTLIFNNSGKIGVLNLISFFEDGDDLDIYGRTAIREDIIKRIK